MNSGSQGSRRPSADAVSCFSKIQSHIPLAYLQKKLDFFLEKSLNPEIYFNYRSLESFTERDLRALAAVLSDHGRSVTVHGPFFDLSPGAVDPAFRAITVKRMRTAIEKAAPFSPEAIVFHPGYDPLRFAEHREVWLRNSCRTWKELLPAVEKLPSTAILIENIFENTPSTLAELLERLPSPPFGFCFDTGHFSVFSEVPLAEWINLLGSRLREVHLHDNDGSGDDHLPPGRGVFDFQQLFKHLRDLPQPVIGTVEAHSEAHLLEGLSYIEELSLLP